MVRNKTVLFFFRLALGGVFIWSGLMKILDPLDFAQNVANYRAFPELLGFLVALILPWTEILCGLLVVTGIWQKAGSLLLSGLLISFLVLISITMLRGIDIDCGCFGIFSRKVDYTLILTDLALLYLALNIPQKFNLQSH